MKVSRLKELLKEGHEIEFDYKGKRYGLTWSDVDGEEGVMAFYEFNKDDIASKNIDEILSAEYHGLKVADIIEDLNEEEVDIF